MMMGGRIAEILIASKGLDSFLAWLKLTVQWSSYGRVLSEFNAWDLGDYKYRCEMILEALRVAGNVYQPRAFCTISLGRVALSVLR